MCEGRALRARPSQLLKNPFLKVKSFSNPRRFYLTFDPPNQKVPNFHGTRFLLTSVATQKWQKLIKKFPSAKCKHIQTTLVAFNLQRLATHQFLSDSAGPHSLFYSTAVTLMTELFLATTNLCKMMFPRS